MRKKMNSSNDLIKVEDATATAALSKVGNSDRRKVLTTGAGLVASAGAPAGIGALGLVLPSEAQATPGTLGSKKILWLDPNFSERTVGWERQIQRRAIVTSGDIIEGGFHIKKTHLLLGLFPKVTVDFQPVSQASCKYSTPDKDFLVKFSKSGIEKIALKRDELLNPLTCDKAWSKSTTIFQHRRLDDEETPGDMTEEQLRRRNEQAMLWSFYDWILNTAAQFRDAGSGPMLSGEINDIMNYVGERQNRAQRMGTTVPSPQSLLERIFYVDSFFATPMFNNAPPSFIRARIRRLGTNLGGVTEIPPYTDPRGEVYRYGSTDNTYFIDMVRRFRPDQDGVVYSTLVTRYNSSNGGTGSMPWHTGIPQPSSPRLVGTPYATRVYGRIVNEMIQSIPDEDLRAAAWGAQTAFLRVTGGPDHSNFVLAPFVMAAMFVARRNGPQGSTPLSTLDTTILAIGTINYVVYAAAAIYDFFRDQDADFATDIANGWRWTDNYLKDDNIRDRQLLGYTYDYNSGLAINPVWKLKIYVGQNVTVLRKTESGAYSTFFPGNIRKHDKLRVKFTFGMLLGAEIEFVISVSHSTRKDVSERFPGVKMFIEGSADFVTKTYTIRAGTGLSPSLGTNAPN